MLFVTSDHHFGHKKIIEYENRPFSSVEEMDEELIRKWNEVVSNDDIVFYLGDFMFYGSRRKAIDILNRLNGRKNLIILGNHDRCHNIGWWERIGFRQALDCKYILGRVILSHEPILYDIGDFHNIHGHIHSDKLSEARNSNKHFNVSVDVTGYRPVSMDRILASIQGREDG